MTIEAPRPVHEIPEDRLHDTREAEEWFQRLPPHAQEEFRGNWRKEERGGHTREARIQETTKRYLIEGALLFVIFEILFTNMTLISLALGIGMGVGMGHLCRCRRFGRYGFSVTGAVFYVALFGILPFQWGGGLSPSGFVIFVVLAGAAGVMHEVQRFDGSEV